MRRRWTSRLLAGLAPKSVIDVYQAPNTGDGKGEGFYDLFKKFAVADTDKVMSVSWGACEARLSAATCRAQGALFEQANAQGQTIFVASGDEGSTTCFDPAASKADDRVSADAPASSPFVIAVGGTSFTRFRHQPRRRSSGTTRTARSASEPGAAGSRRSGACRTTSTRPRSRASSTPNRNGTPANPARSKTFREIPDVAADGDPLFGYATFYNGSWVFGGVGGTSAATPVWASIAALMNVSPYCKAYGTKAPLLPQNLYSAGLHLSLLHLREDIAGRAGCHDRQQRLHAIWIYGRAVQVGQGLRHGQRPRRADGQRRGNHKWFVYLAGLTQVLCHNAATKLRTVKVTGVSPKSGPAGKAARSRCTGPGSCRSASPTRRRSGPGPRCSRPNMSPAPRASCTVKLPAESARTVDIRIFALSLWPSQVSKADHYVYK